MNQKFYKVCLIKWLIYISKNFPEEWIDKKLRVSILFENYQNHGGQKHLDGFRKGIKKLIEDYGLKGVASTSPASPYPKGKYLLNQQELSEWLDENKTNLSEWIDTTRKSD